MDLFSWLGRIEFIFKKCKPPQFLVGVNDTYEVINRMHFRRLTFFMTLFHWRLKISITLAWGQFVIYFWQLESTKIYYIKNVLKIGVLWVLSTVVSKTNCIWFHVVYKVSKYMEKNLKTFSSWNFHNRKLVKHPVVLPEERQ